MKSVFSLLLVLGFAIAFLSVHSPLAAQPETGPRVDLNQATASELDELPGIGPAIAGRIIEYREENGPFERIEDLMNVRGIGEKKFESLRDLVTVQPVPAESTENP